MYTQGDKLLEFSLIKSQIATTEGTVKQCGDFDAAAVFIDLYVCVQCFNVHAVNLAKEQSTAEAKN